MKNDCFKPLIIMLWLLSITSHTLADVVSDGTMNTTVTPISSNNVNITGGTRPGNGTNLFHSFTDFSISSGGSANFVNDMGVETTNIVSRVTGSNTSTIYGSITTTDFAGVNLWLINPAGIVFGPGASLPADASFHASTADYIRLSDNTVFDLSTEAAQLTMANPVSFGFLTPPPSGIAAISVSDVDLSVSAGQTLSLVGGDIHLSNTTITAAGGRLNLASVAAAGEVTPQNAVNSGMAIVDVNNFGQITLDAANLITDGDGGGDIFIRGGQFIMTTNASVSADNNGITDGGTVELNVATLNMTDSDISSDTNYSGSPTPGDGGTVHFVNVQTMTMDNSTITANSNLGGNAGELIFDNIGTLAMTNNSAITAITDFGGTGGNITFNAIDQLALTGNSEISVSSTIDTNARAGVVTIFANDSIDIANGSAIHADSGGGIAGGIIIDAPVINVSGLIEAKTLTQGNGTETFTITADQLNINEGGRVSTLTEGTADAGTMTITTDTLAINGGEIISSTNNEGNGGNIQINTTNLVMQQAGEISANTTGMGQGGTITIDAPNIALAQSSRISSDTSYSGSPITGDGGTVHFMNVQTMTMDNSTITSNSNLGGNAGELIFDNIGTLAMTNNSAITAVTDFGGTGGNITFNAIDQLALTGNSEISVSSTIDTNARAGVVTIFANDSIDIANGSAIHADSGGGIAGGIIIDAPVINVSGLIEAKTLTQGNGTETFTITADQLNINEGGRVSTLTEGTADAGTMEIHAGTLTISGGEITSSSNDEGTGGDINIYATNVAMISGAEISSASTGLMPNAGAAGSILIQDNQSLTLNDSRIQTRSENSTGGNITINTRDLVYLNHSEITSSANGLEPGDDGGNVYIDPTFVVLDNSLITARANIGDGGNIEITTDNFIADPNSDINASSNEGIDGEILINSPNQDMTAAVTLLDTSFLNVVGLLRPRCSSSISSELDSFTISGRNRLSPPIDEYFKNMIHFVSMDSTN